MDRRRGCFIVLEGADGCGKSTQAARVVAWLRARGRTVDHVRDPGGTRLSEAIRRLLLDPESGRLTVEAETFLHMAARAQLAAEAVAPALSAGRDVVSERWTLSTEVYQGLAGGFGVRNVRLLGRLVAGGLLPDLVLVLDVEVGGGLARITRTPDRMEQKGSDFHAHVVRAYRRLARKRKGHVLVPGGDPDEVTARIEAEVLPLVR